MFKTLLKTRLAAFGAYYSGAGRRRGGKKQAGAGRKVLYALLFLYCFVAFGGIDICYDAPGSHLDAPDVICHHSVRNDIKFVDSAVRTDQKLLQCIRDIDTGIQICDHVITVGYSI